MKLPGWLARLLGWYFGHDAPTTCHTCQVPETERDVQERKALEFIRRNRKNGRALIVVAALVMPSCLGVNIGPALECRAKGGSWQDNGDGTGFCKLPPPDCRDKGHECVDPLKCLPDPKGVGYPHQCQLEATPPPTTLPGPKDCTVTGCPTHGEQCVQLTKNPPKYGCVPIATPTPSPSASPSPVPTPSPTPAPTPTPCVPSVQKVCVDANGSVTGIFNPKDESGGPNSCWSCKAWLAYMMRDRWDDACQCIKPGSAQYTPGDPAEDGDAGGYPGFWIHRRDDGSVQKLVSKKDCRTPAGSLEVDFKRVEERVVPCPSPSPTPSPSPSTPPSPLPGVACTPLSHVGVAFHAQHPAPNGPLGYRWIFSATPKSRKPFCPDKRNECEQQAYQGDPVNDYDHVTWRFDLRFQCQDPAGPLWNQQEPHTGSSWEPTDVRQENAYMANLKPAVKGLHRVRTCRRDAPTVCEYAEKVAN